LSFSYDFDNSTFNQGFIILRLRKWLDPDYDTKTSAYLGDDIDASIGSIYLRNEIIAQSKDLGDSDWIYIDFVADDDCNGVIVEFFCDDSEKGSATVFAINNAWLYEPHNVDALVLANHNLSEVNCTVKGYFEDPTVNTQQQTDTGDSDFTLLNAQVVNAQDSVIELSERTSCPIYEITLDPISKVIPNSIGQIGLFEKWELLHNPDMPYDPDFERMQHRRDTMIGGTIVDTIHFTQHQIRGRVIITESAEWDRWADWWEYHGKNSIPFFVVTEDGADPIWMIGSVIDFNRPYEDSPYTRSFELNFVEQK
jgi:hypothetical protein